MADTLMPSLCKLETNRRLSATAREVGIVTTMIHTID
jgi:hypothetical protein